MVRRELSETLGELISAFEADERQGLTVIEAIVEAPLRIDIAVRDGRPVLVGGAAETVMRTGFEPTVHRTRMTAVPIPTPTLGDHGDDSGR